MSNRIESSPLAHLPSEQTQSSHAEKERLAQNAIDLAFFLDGAQLSGLRVISIIPSTKIGISYTVAIGRTALTPEGSETVWHTVDNRAIDMLQNALDISPKKTRKKSKSIIKNLKIINRFVSDPTNWNSTFNPGISS